MVTLPGDDFFEEKLRAKKALYKVIDPELFVNIIDLGLIYDIAFLEVDIIKVTMTFSTPHCPMGESIKNGVENALLIEFPGKDIEIIVTFDPPWSFEMLTPEGKEMLGV